MIAESNSQQVATLVAALAQDEGIIAPTIQRVLDEVPAYAVASHEDLVGSVKRNVTLAVKALRSGEVPRLDEIWQAEKATLERLRSGIPIEDIMSGFRISIATIQGRLVELAEDHPVAGEDLVAMTRLLWKLSDAFSARAAAAYRLHGMKFALAEQRRRDEWLLSLLVGELGSAALEHGFTTYRLERGREYHPFCAVAVGGASLDDAHILLDKQFEGADGWMATFFTSRLVGILPHVPAPLAGYLIAVGPPSLPEGLADRYRIANDVLDAASIHFDEGIHTLETLGWRIGVPQTQEFTALVRDRYITRLKDAGAFGDEVIAAVRALLDHERNIRHAAAAMHVHVNTLRYRLSRFEEVTGRSLSDTDTLIELSWALYSERGDP